MVDWSKTILAVVGLAAKQKRVVDPHFLVLKPRLLSDENLLTAVGALRIVLGAIPSTALASHVLGLGDVGFRLWKRVALQAEYDQLEVLPVGINVMSLKIRLDPVLRTHFLHLLGEQRLPEAREVFNAVIYITDPAILQEKYPQLPQDYVERTCAKNKQLLGEVLGEIVQVVEKHRTIPEVDQNLRAALEALLHFFPAMRDWSLLKSENFDEILEVLDTVV